MIQKESKEVNALDLLIEDLNVVHSDIRTRAKTLACENELDNWKNEVLEYLQTRRESL